jgi:hypothetical protein
MRKNLAWIDIKIDGNVRTAATLGTKALPRGEHTRGTKERKPPGKRRHRLKTKCWS